MPYLNARIAAACIGGLAIAFAGAATPAAVLGPNAAACEPGAEKPAMLVHIEGLRERDGKLRVQAYGGDPARYFEKGAYLERIDVDLPRRGPVDVCLPVPHPGTYAVSVKHDRDAAGGLSLKDGGGFSGNPNVSALDLMFRRKPSPSQVQIAVRGLTRVPVTVKYLQDNL